ncbi:hypothetical protein Tco_1540843 [Tanacetum coccineum]
MIAWMGAAWRYYSHNNDYLEICRCYKSIYEIPSVKEDPAKWTPVLLVAFLQTELPLGLSLVIQLSFDKPKRSYRHLFSGPELAEGFQDAFLGVDPRDVSVPMVGGQSVNGGGVTSADDIYIGETDSAKPREKWRIEMTDHIQDKGYKGNFDLRLRVAGRGTQLLKHLTGQSVNGGGVTSADDIYIGETDSAKPRENLLHIEGSKVFVSAAAGSVGNFVGEYAKLLG